MKEVFKDIKGYEGTYQVSDLGNVKRLSSKVSCGGNKYRTCKERVLKGGVSSSGYKNVTLSKNGSVKTFNIHQLVAWSFISSYKEIGDKVIDHINNCKKDNRVGNLQVISFRENNTKDSVNKNGYSGVVKINNRFFCKIHIQGKQTYLGSFSTKKLAGIKYKKACDYIKANNNYTIPQLKRL